MSTLTATAEEPRTAPARPAYRVTGRRVLASEWAKLWSLRSTWITLGLGLLFLVAFGLISASRYKSGIDSGHMDRDFTDSTAVSLSLFGTNFAQLALGVLGVLVTAGEYSTGMIRSTLAAVPHAAARAVVQGGCVRAGRPGRGDGRRVRRLPVRERDRLGHAAAMSLSHAGVLRSLLGAGLYLGLVGVIGVALGALLRSVAGGISVLVAALMLIPGLISLLPSSWRDDISPYLPSNAGESMFALTHDSTSLSPGAGLLVFLCWTVLALGGAAYRLTRSDV